MREVLSKEGKAEDKSNTSKQCTPPTSPGQFHDALAELLQWIGTESSALTTAPPPGVEEETISRKIQDLEVGVAPV